MLKTNNIYTTKDYQKKEDSASGDFLTYLGEKLSGEFFSSKRREMLIQDDLKAIVNERGVKGGEFSSTYGDLREEKGIQKVINLIVSLNREYYGRKKND